MSNRTGADGRLRDGRPPEEPVRGGGRFGAATPGIRAERAGISDLVTASSGRRRRFITPWRVTALIAALLAAGGSYALGRYVIAPKPAHTVQIAVIDAALPAGTKLTPDDIRVVTVQAGQVPSGYLGPNAAVSVIGFVLKQPVAAGTFLSRSLLTLRGGLPDASQALVGLDLKVGEIPAGGLAVGQKVLVVLLPVSSQGVPLNPVPLINTTVWDLQPPGNGGDVEASVIVPTSVATKLASYAARSQVSLVATSAPPPPATTPSPKPSSSHKPAKRHSR
ncbi:MAG TPA: SAF domain-containing protein [Streptosporangiaceae bacterium]|nr:SAF domain-containing protein [Streptosporangiaceae bacterium]